MIRTPQRATEPLPGRSDAAITGGRAIASAGFAFVITWLIGLAIGFAIAAPAPTATVATLGAYFATHREAVMLQAYLLDGIAGIALVIFAAALYPTLREHEEGNGTVASIAFGAGIAAGTVSLLQGLFTQVLADHVAALGDAAAIRTLYDLNAEGDTFKLLALGVLLAATSVDILRTHVLPRWLGWLGAVLAPLLIVAGWNFLLSTSAQYTAYSILLVLLLVWVAGMSLASVQRRR